MASKGGKSSSSKSNPSDFQPHSHKPDEPLQEEELEALYAWVDSIPLSRPKRNISRDFADGVLVAEIMHHCFPKMVEMHNYGPANSSIGKETNWLLLNRKVFPKLNFELAEDVINDLCSCKAGMIEKVLMMLKVKIKSAEYARGHQSDKPEADQHQMTPGRKTIKVGMEDTKGSRFVKTKQLQDQKSPPKMPPKPAVTQKRRTGPVVESDMVPRYVVEEKEQEVLSRDETIQILQAKIQRMEHLLQLKDIRIAELTDHADRFEQNGYTHIHGSQKAAPQSHGVHQGAQVHGVFYKPSLYSYSH